jgi:hypothetical protein
MAAASVANENFFEVSMQHQDVAGVVECLLQ